MSVKAGIKKRPCRICRRWFSPDPRVGDRQKTCGGPDCRREWHRRKCAAWNRKNPDYFQNVYLQKKLEAAMTAGSASPTPPSDKPAHRPPKSLIKPKVPLEVIQEAIGLQQAVIMDYMVRLLLRRFQEVIQRQVPLKPG